MEFWPEGGYYEKVPEKNWDLLNKKTDPNQSNMSVQSKYIFSPGGKSYLCIKSYSKPYGLGIRIRSYRGVLVNPGPRFGKRFFFL